MRSTTVACPASVARSATSTSTPRVALGERLQAVGAAGDDDDGTPAAASRPAIASPIPLDAPVTSADGNG